MKKEAEHEIFENTESPEFALKKCQQWAKEDGIQPEELDAYINDCLRFFSIDDF